MATAAQVTEAALKRILVQGANASLQADEYADAVDSMNNFMLDLDANGVSLGYTFVNSLSDEVTIPTGALRGLIANLAVDISPDYGGEVSPALVKAADDGLKTMYQLGVSVSPASFPGTLPKGSGNYVEESSPFYPCNNEDEILRETTGAIGLESGTAGAI
jgi:hypothetical protein